MIIHSSQNRRQLCNHSILQSRCGSFTRGINIFRRLKIRTCSLTFRRNPDRFFPSWGGFSLQFPPLHNPISPRPEPMGCVRRQSLPNFFWPSNFVMPRKMCSKRVLQTKIFPRKVHFRLQTLKPGYGPDFSPSEIFWTPTSSDRNWKARARARFQFTAAITATSHTKRDLLSHV